MAGVHATSARYVMPLDADDALAPGSLAALADALDREPAAVMAWGDIEIWGDVELRLKVGRRLDPWQITHLNTLPVASMVRRDALLAVDGWQLRNGYEDWDLWMSFAERGWTGVYVPGVALRYRRRDGRMLADCLPRHDELMAELRARHPDLYRRRRPNWRGSSAPMRVRMLFPAVSALPVSDYNKSRLYQLADQPRQFIEMRRSAQGARMSPRVTVLLAVHDGEPYVRESVASVLDQTFQDFEFVIVDDASTDRTVELVESFRDPRIRLLRNERNLGQVPSLNRGLREARGEYVARIDHDDWCRPRRLERQVAVLDAQPDVALVGTWMDLVDEGGRPIARLRSTIADFPEFLFHTLIMRVLVSHPSAMYRREPVLRLGGYDESTGPAEDKDLWRRLALERWDARIVPEPLVVYRLHDAQLSQTRAAYQRDVDGESQERFLTALSPETPVHRLRLLLSNDAAFWTEDGDGTLAGLDRLLADARVRLRLDDAEAGRVEQLVAGRVLEVAATRPWRRRGAVAQVVRPRAPGARAACRRGRGLQRLVRPLAAQARRPQNGPGPGRRRRPGACAARAPRPRQALAGRPAHLREGRWKRLMPDVESIRREQAELESAVRAVDRPQHPPG